MNIRITKDIIFRPKPNVAFGWRLNNFIKYISIGSKNSDRVIKDFIYYLESNATKCTIDIQSIEPMVSLDSSWDKVLQNHKRYELTIDLLKVHKTRFEKLSYLNEVIQLGLDRYKCVVIPYTPSLYNSGVEIKMYGIKEDVIIELLKKLPLDNRQIFKST